ncbi:LysE family transporter [Microbacterium sp.]|uniref:LysE family transporter n=1 Tax=Microbacterium sp. TaxID=51671 RepID=UPI0025EA709A|nr:LysE family transporter [Microbacterium sp.]
MDPFAAHTTGLVVGLALVIPLGAIGVLLIQEGASLGWARGVPAAAAVATADLLYCTVAVIGGAVLSPVISSWGPWPKVLGGAALVVLAVWNLIRARRSTVKGSPDALSPRGRPSQRYAVFFGLTAINPATVVYFAATVTGFSELMASAVSAAMFVVGVAAASLGWQLLLVLVGAIVHWRAGVRFRGITAIMGNCAVCTLGVLMIAGALS